MKKIVSTLLILCTVFSLFTVPVFAGPGDPCVEIIATETETEVNVSIVVKNTAQLSKFEVSVGYDKNKLAYKASSISYFASAVWNLGSSNTTGSDFNDSANFGYIQMGNAYNATVNPTPVYINCSGANGFEVGSFTFTKLGTVTAGDIFDASGMKFGVAPTMVLNSSINTGYGPATQLYVNNSTLEVTTDFEPYSVASIVPAVVINSVETETEVNVSVVLKKAAEVSAFNVAVGYDMTKLEYKTGTLDVYETAAWINNTSRTDREEDGGTNVGLVEITNNNGGTATYINASGTAGFEIATFTFTKLDAITAADIFDASGKEVSAAAIYTAVDTGSGAGLETFSAEDHATMVTKTFEAFIAGIKVSIEGKASYNYIENGIIYVGIYGEEFDNVDALLVDFEYDVNVLELAINPDDINVFYLNDNNGKVRLIAGLENTRSSAARELIYSLPFKMKLCEEDTTTEVKMTYAALGILEGICFEVQTTIVPGKDIAVINILLGFNWDINRDGYIDEADLAHAQEFLGSRIGDSDWEDAKRADADGDGEVTIHDFLLIALYIATHYAPPPAN